jgi:Regulator of chromosome condensation (RCC1) repeat
MVLALLWGCRSSGEGIGTPSKAETRTVDTGAAPGKRWPLTAAEVSLSDSAVESGGSDSGDTAEDTAEGEWPGLNLNYRRVSVGGYVSCGLTDVGKVVCWGSNQTQQLDTPAGIFLEVSILNGSTCALREDGQIICWGTPLNPNFEYPPPPSGQWARLDCSSSGCAALDTEGHMTWWHTVPEYFITYDPPDGQFIDIDVGSNGVCALTISRDIRCWYKEDASSETVMIRLEGEFKKLSGVTDHGCGLDGDGSMYCWDESGNETQISGSFKDMSITNSWNCYILQDDTPSCWGCVWGQYCENGIEIPDIPLVQVSSDMEHACGLTHDNRFVCWGWDWYSETQPPEEYR